MKNEEQEKKRQLENGTDANIIVDETIFNDKDAEEDIAIRLETNLVMLCHLIYAVDSIEKRTVVNFKSRFITNALAIFGDVWKHEFTKISGKAEKIFTKPIIWCYATLLEKANQESNKPLMLTLLGLLEMTARDLGDVRLNFIDAVLLTVRHKMLKWKMEEVNQDTICEEPEIAQYMKLYDECAPGSNELKDPEKLSIRRKFFMKEEYLDKTTFRGKGRDTMSNFNAGVEALGVDISSWSEEEINKSHGKGVIMNKKQSQQLPTYTYFHLEVGCYLCPEQMYISDPYEQKACKIYLDEEEAFTPDKCKASYILSRRYPAWVAAFTSKIIDDYDNVQQKKRKYGSGCNGYKGSKSSLHKKKKLKHLYEYDSNGIEYNKNLDNIKDEEEVTIIRKEHSSQKISNLVPGKLLRIKYIVYESASEDEQNEDMQISSEKAIPLLLISDVPYRKI
jgi:hypothetical protein